jgi:hypothetical protein
MSTCTKASPVFRGLNRIMCSCRQVMVALFTGQFAAVQLAPCLCLCRLVVPEGYVAVGSTADGGAAPSPHHLALYVYRRPGRESVLQVRGYDWDVGRGLWSYVAVFRSGGSVAEVGLADGRWLLQPASVPVPTSSLTCCAA